MSLLARLHGRLVFGRRISRLADHIGALVPIGARVLDIGCGDGSLAARLEERRPDLTIRGVDVLVRAATHIPVARFDGYALPIRDRGVDVALLVDVLHHADDPLALLREAARVAARGIIVKDHLADRFGARTTLRLMDWVGNAPHGVRLPYNYWRRDQWRAAFATLGLRSDAWLEQLGLYPQPLSTIFDSSLHVVTRLVAA